MRRASILIILLLFFSAASIAQKSSGYKPDELTREAYDQYLHDPDQALKLTEQALERALKTQDIFKEGYCYFLLSKIYWVKANYKLSTQYGFKALKIFEKSPYYQEYSECLLAMARTLVELGNYAKARTFILDALQLGLLHSNINIEACAYREHSYLLAEINQLDSALMYSDKGIALFERSQDSLDISVLYGRKARIYYQQGDFVRSKVFAYQALHIDSLVENRRGLGISYFQVAQNEYAQGNRKKAIAQLKESIRINREIGNLNWQIKAHELLSSLYMDNMPLLAAAELQKVSKFKDELYNSEKNGQIQEMQSLHDLEAKESTIRFLEQQNTLKQQEVKNQRLFVALLLVAMLFLLLLIFVLTRLRTLQNKANRNLASQNIAIEEQKKAIQVQAENLKDLDHIKTKLFSVISHDLRGPISNLQSLLDMFTRKLMTAGEFISLSERLKENLNITQRTLENLLNWSLSQMGGIRTEKKKIEINDGIAEACMLLEEVASRKNVVLNRQFTDVLYVWADANQLQVILRNLIHNAIKFSSYNSRINISASRESHWCQITIKDSGIGMTEAEINTLIGSKEYFSKTGTEQEKGTGLGLLLCKEFIIRNGGAIAIRSSMGGGTEVSFTLMLAEHEGAPRLAVPG
ncbi:MAG: tetratricopeptide repeat-containing sensor histidine kinase [Chryseosolibacter sp.]